MLATPLFLSGCGSSGIDNGETADQPVSLISKGMITGFGSAYVNSVKYQTADSDITVDDESGVESDSKIGMIVSITGEIDENGHSGIAHKIVYDNELKGPVSQIDEVDATTEILTILGQIIAVNVDTRFVDDENLVFATLALNDILEVSGYLTATGLIATHVEKQTTAI
ncbi:MAG: hypothetical protein ACI8XC_004510 [Gammaproteobacteria bacterium]|jgi:hypothetical protein